MRLLIALALLLFATAIADAADVKCGERPLAVCTRERVEALHRLSAELKEAAAADPEKRPSAPKEVEALDAYNRWLLAQSEKAAALATRGEAALAATKKMQETLMSFNLQYLQLQSRMQRENRAFTAVSNVMKTKHDTVKNSISNVR
jgi:hypothetical protein